MRHSSLLNNSERIGHLELDAYEINVLIESIKLQLHKKVDSCDISSIPELCLMLIKLKELMDTLPEPLK